MRWPVVHVGEVVAVNPKDSLGKCLSDAFLVSFVPMQAVSESSAAIVERHVRPFGEVKKGYTSFRDGDVLFAKITPCMENGKSALATGLENGLGLGSTEFHVLRAGAAVLPRFVHYIVRQPAFRVAAKQRMCGAAGQQRVPSGFVEEWPLPLPPLSEQRRIVEILDRADRLRRLRSEADAKAARILPALFLKMLGDPATNPMEWPVKRLREMLEIGLRNGISPSHSGGVRFTVLTLSAITGSVFDASEVKESTFADTPADDKLVDERDFLICRGNGSPRLTARGFYPSRSMSDVVFPDTMIAARVDRGQLDREFVQAVWSSDCVRRQLDARMKTTSGIYKINQAALEAIEFPVPPLVLQQEFAKRAAALETCTNPAAGAKLRAIFEGLLESAFRGTLTAGWREAHMAELVQEMEQQARALGMAERREVS
jgi:type I restriction enzyme S subunit